jgi:hypothetical protein
MAHNFQQRLSGWYHNHSLAVEQFAAFNNAGASWAIYGSTAVWMLTGKYRPRDMDVVVPPESFDSLIPLMPEGTYIRRELDAQLICGDGLILQAPAVSAELELNNTPVEIMASGRAHSTEHSYNLSFSPLAARHAIEIKIGNAILYLANIFDIIAVKSILQRGALQNKRDKADVLALLEQYDIDISYAISRGEEMGLDKRTLLWLSSKARIRSTYAQENG